MISQKFIYKLFHAVAHRQIFHEFLSIFLDILRRFEAQKGNALVIN